MPRMSKDTEIDPIAAFVCISSRRAWGERRVPVSDHAVGSRWGCAGLLLILVLQRHGPPAAIKHPARVFLVGTLLLSAGLVLAWWLLPKPLSVMGLITEWRNQEDRPSLQVLREYRYLSARFTLSKSGDWSGRAYVEVSDSNVDDIKRYVPARLRIRQTGTVEVIADILRFSSGGVNREGAILPSSGEQLQLVTPDFLDFHRQVPSGAYSPEQLQYFDLESCDTKLCSMTLSLIVDGNVLKRQTFQMRQTSDNLEFTPLN